VRFLLIAIIFAVGLSLIAVPRLFHEQQVAAHEARMERELQELQREGAFRVPAETDDKPVFSVPVQSFFYGGGFTFGQLKKDLAQRALEGTAGLERNVSFVEYIRYVAGTFVRGTRYEGKVSINEPPRSGFINLYFVQRPEPSQGRDLQAPQCSYVGFADAILCDAGSVSRAFAEIDRITKNRSVVIAVLEPDHRLRVNMEGNLDVLRRLLKQNLLIWLIGHEIGHALRDREWILSHESPLHFEGAYDDRERGADAYVAEVVLKDKLLGANFATLLLEFINHQFEQEYISEYGHAPKLGPAAKEEPLLKLRSGRFSRPLLLRAIQVMEQVLKRDPSAMDRADYTVVEGRLGYVHSIQFPEQVKLLRSRIVVQSETDGRGLTLPIVIALLPVAVGCTVWLAGRQQGNS